VPEAVFAIPGHIESPTGGYGYDRQLLRLLPALGVKVHHLELPGSFPDPSPEDIDRAITALSDTPDGTTLLIDGLAFGAMPRDRIAGIGRRIIALVHHPLALETGLTPERKSALLESERDALSLAERVIVTSPATGRQLVNDYSVDDARITVAEPGTDPAQRATGTGMPLQLLCVGAVSRRKGYDVLIAALKPLAHLDWRLTITGATDRDTTAVSELESEIASAGFHDRITLAGVVVPATLERFYESADVFVLPSLHEGYGMVLGEAMARGLPIVCTNGGALAETVPEGAAIKVAPGDAEQLSRALEQALTDRKLRARLADAAWEAGRSLPTWNETARRVAAVIMDIKT